MRNFSLAILLYGAFAVSTFSSENSNTAQYALNGPVTIRTDAGASVEGIPSVTKRIMELFKSNRVPLSITGRNFQEVTPDYMIINGADNKSTLIYRFRYINPESVVDAVEAVISDVGTVEVLKDQGNSVIEINKIIINDKKEKMDELRQMLIALDQMQPQVLVETQVIEVYIEQGAERDVKLQYAYHDGKYNTDNIFGFNQESPGQDKVTGQGAQAAFVPFAMNSSDGSTGRLNAAIRWLNTSSNARILSAPNIIADQGTTASIITGEDLPIPQTTTTSSSTSVGVNYKRIGVTLNITPKVINGNTVQLEVNPEVKAAIRYQTFTSGVGSGSSTSQIPVISVRSVDTRLTVCDGDIIALGGLYSSETTEQLRKIPYIGDIPVLGDLLNGRDTSTLDKQLIFLMKIHILQPQKMKMLDLESTADQMHSTADMLKSSDTLFTNKPPAEFYDVEKNLTETSKENIRQKVNQRQKISETKSDKE